MRKYFLISSLFFSINLGAVLAPQTNEDSSLYDNEGEKYPPTLTGANAEAVYWLNLVDQAQYRATWGAAADLFKDVVSIEQWVAAMKGSRKPLGTLRSRKLTKYDQLQALPHGTKGNFMIIQFRSQFSNKAYADEYVTLISQGSLSQWKVLSYKLLYK